MLPRETKLIDVEPAWYSTLNESYVDVKLRVAQPLQVLTGALRRQDFQFHPASGQYRPIFLRAPPGNH